MKISVCTQCPNCCNVSIDDRKKELVLSDYKCYKGKENAIKEYERRWAKEKKKK